MDWSTSGLPVHHQLPEFTKTHVHWVGDAIQPSHPLLSPSPPALNLSQHQGLFSNKSTLLMRWPKYWSFSFSISPSNEHPGLISFKMDWLELLAVQGTLNSLLQHHSSKASILRCSAFLIVQLSYPYMTTGKTIALTRRTFVGKVMSLLFNTLSRLVITFLPRGKRLLISWLQSPSAVIVYLGGKMSRTGGQETWRDGDEKCIFYTWCDGKGFICILFAPGYNTEMETIVIPSLYSRKTEVFGRLWKLAKVMQAAGWGFEPGWSRSRVHIGLVLG